MARQVLKTYRTAEDHWAGAVRCQRKLSCDGCTFDHCCYQIPLGTLTSGILIADYLLEHDQQRLLAIVEQGQQQAMLIASNPKGYADEWFGNPCALLDNGRCSVYELRPPACSSYFVVTPRSLCEKATADTLVNSADNTAMFMMGLQGDVPLLAAMGIPGAGETLLIGPLGRMVAAGVAALHSDEAIKTFLKEQVEVQR